MEITEMSVNCGYSCNNNCRHCFLGDERYKGDQRYEYSDRTTEEIISLIDEAVEEGASHLTIIGGDPTIRDDFFQILRYAQRQNFDRLYLETNARSFSIRDFAEKVFSISPELEVGMSFHHTNPKVHDKITRVEGSWKQSVQGIKNMMEQGLNHLRVNVVVSKLNYKNLPELVEFLDELGADELSFYLMRIEGNAERNLEELLISIDEAQPYLFEALEKNKDLDVTLKTFGFPYCKMPGHEEYIEEKDALRGYLEDEAQIFNELDGKSNWQKDRLKSKRKAQKCKECRFFNVCEGLWQGYLEIYGPELIKPVEGEKFKSVKELENL